MYQIEPEYKMLEWVEKRLIETNANVSRICANPRAVGFLEKYPEKIDWEAFCRNPSDRALDIIEKNLDKVKIYSLCCNRNPRAIEIVESRIDEIASSPITSLSENTCDKAVELLEKYPDRISSWLFSQNPNPKALDFLERNLDKAHLHGLLVNENPKGVDIALEHFDRLMNNDMDTGLNWMGRIDPKYIYASLTCHDKTLDFLDERFDDIRQMVPEYVCPDPDELDRIRKVQGQIHVCSALAGKSNPKALALLEKHLDFDNVDWRIKRALSENESEAGLDFLEKYENLILWEYLPYNKNDRAIRILERNMNKIDWKALSQNPNDRAFDLLERNINRIDWSRLSINSNDRAIHLLDRYNYRIDWGVMLCQNKNPGVVYLIDKYYSSWYNPWYRSSLYDSFVDVLLAANTRKSMEMLSKHPEAFNPKYLNQLDSNSLYVIDEVETKKKRIAFKGWSI